MKVMIKKICNSFLSMQDVVIAMAALSITQKAMDILLMSWNELVLGIVYAELALFIVCIITNFIFELLCKKED